MTTEIKRVPAADALPVGTPVHYYEDGGFRRIALNKKLHRGKHLDDDGTVKCAKIQNGEVMLYLLEFADSCGFWVPPWEVTPL